MFRPATIRVSTLAILIGTAGSAAASNADLYLEKIKPLLRERCYACHGALKQKAKLRLDTAKAMHAAGIIEKDLLFRITHGDAEERMPPEGEPLHEAQISAIRQWLEAGAPVPENESPDTDPDKHWAFQAIARPPVPPGGQANPVDAFLAAGHREQGLTPQPEAGRTLLLRRLYLDLTGLPPTAEELASKDGYEDIVNQLLGRPQYGERWARHWMDVWRYSDWWGLGKQLRNSQKHMWHWRDWIVESLNDDVPYDEMVRLMLSADERHPNDLGKLRATGFLARNFFLFNRSPWMEETVEHVGKSFLGLTFNCAKCHDHKFDPIDHADFYRFRAFFEPYHVRMDVVPGESDLEKDGIPRVYDGVLDAPTYRYIRGDERNPDTSKVIQPGVPEFFEFAQPEIKPVSLPREAWEPGSRSWIPESELALAKKKIQEAHAKVEAAKQKLRAAEQRAAKQPKPPPEPPPETPPAAPPPLVEESFAALDKARWKLFGGDWVHTPGRLEQKKDGANRSVLRLVRKPPRDFDATVRFRIEGGSKWRSVGLSFDTNQDDPASAKPGDSEQNVYVSAVSGGTKVQASYQRGGKWEFPGPPGRLSTPIALKKEYTLRVQARGTLVNAMLNGEPVIAWRSPVKRKDGALQLTTYDALTTFLEFSLSPLAPGIVLDEPLGQAKPVEQDTVEGAREALKLAELDAAAARAGLDSVERRAEASRDPAKRETAIRAERKWAVAMARRAVAAAAPKDRKKAQDALAKAEKGLESPVSADQSFTRFTGAKWTPTRFINSGKDDPVVAFPAQSTGRRSALAGWITDRRNPLAARVAVNHIWTRHMGEPLVATLFDFGRKGARPVQPELLDWLAAEFMDNGWSMKHLHRLIVTSAAYRRSSSMAGGEGNLEKDPDNRYGWRRATIRMESQVVRDAILSLAGSLDLQLGGPPVAKAQQEASKRRSLYFFHSNNERNSFLVAFDDALVTDCYRREQTVVPQQALALANSRLVLDAAPKIAARLSEAAAGDAAFIRKSFGVLLGIDAGEKELAASTDALAAWRKLPGGSNDTARAQFIWTLINHNDFVTLR